MKAIAVVKQGEPAQLIDLPVPLPGPGHFRIRVQAAGLNPYDGKRAGGVYGELTLPFVPGTEGAGLVEAVGEGVTKFAVGDRVFGRLGDAGHGTYAEYVIAAEEGTVAHVPAGVEAEVAAVLPVAGLTALGLLRALGLASGERILIVGATGGVGGFLVQMAAKAGLEVVATARPEYTARVRELGAGIVVDHTSTTPVAQQLAAQGVDRLHAIADLAGARDLVDSVASLLVPGGNAGVDRGWGRRRSVCRPGNQRLRFPSQDDGLRTRRNRGNGRRRRHPSGHR